ncbi:MAG: hypothetical protein COB88_08700 [Flavobacteriales bacterium]|nr:MAG: hypothetical protein COB88_08700 [Flavobacteriales bacterium]
MFNLKSKAKRLVGVWRATKQVENGTEFLNDHTIELNILENAKNPEGTFDTYTLYKSNGAIEEYHGTWELSKDKKEFLMYYNSVDYNYGQGWKYTTLAYTSTQRIKRLTSDDLWLEEHSDNYDLYLEYKKD